jgi:hypothetical protein
VDPTVGPPGQEHYTPAVAARHSAKPLGGLYPVLNAGAHTAFGEECSKAGALDDKRSILRQPARCPAARVPVVAESIVG